MPFEYPEVIPRLFRRGDVVRTEDRPEGTFVIARISEADVPVVADFVISPVARRVQT